MKRDLYIILTLLTVTTFGQTKTVNIRDNKFIFKTFLVDNENGDSTKQVELYRNSSKLLTHIISKFEGDCNSESIELGTFETTDTTVIFYSYWTRAGDAPVSPFGVRKQIYSVDKKGNLNLTKAELYLETSRQGWLENNGIKYLFSIPKNDKEKKQLKVYLNETEQTYNGKFVFGPTKHLLFKEVRAKLKRQIQIATKDWKKLYADKIGGYKI